MRGSASSARNRHTLALATRDTVLTDDCVVAFGETSNELMRLGSFGRCNHFRLAGLRASLSDIGTDAV